MTHLYGIYHEYEEDGGFGDAVHQSDLVAICESEELAHEYVKKHSHTVVYWEPYDSLTCGTLEVVDFKDMLVVTEDTIERSPFNEYWQNQISSGEELPKEEE